MLSVKQGMLVLTCLMILTACEMIPTTAIGEGDSTRVACEVFGVITFSASQDTPETIREIREHNAAYESLGC